MSPCAHTLVRLLTLPHGAGHGEIGCSDEARQLHLPRRWPHLPRGQRDWRQPSQMQNRQQYVPLFDKTSEREGERERECVCVCDKGSGQVCTCLSHSHSLTHSHSLFTFLLVAVLLLCCPIHHQPASLAPRRASTSQTSRSISQPSPKRTMVCVMACFGLCTVFSVCVCVCVRVCGFLAAWGFARVEYMLRALSHPLFGCACR